MISQVNSSHVLLGMENEHHDAFNISKGGYCTKSCQAHPGHKRPERIDIHWEERRLAAKAKSKDFQKFLDTWKFRFDRNDKISLMFFFYTNSFCCILILKTVNFSKDAHVSL